MRAAVSTMPLFAPMVEIRIATTTNAAPAAPIVTLAASDATSADFATPLGDSTYRYALLARTWNPITMIVGRMMERGRFLPGSTIPAPPYVDSIRPAPAQHPETRP